MKDTATLTPQLSIVDKLRLLLDITKKISRSLDLSEVLNLVMDTLGSLIPYNAAGIYLIECDEKSSGLAHDSSHCHFHTEVVRGYDTEDLFDLHLKMGEGFIGYVALTGDFVLSQDVTQDERYFNARSKTRSEMVAPIISNDKVIGVFDIESDRLNAYNSDDLQILVLLASQVAIIIEKVMLHGQLIEKQRLESQLEVARQVQLELLPPRDPRVEGYDISAYNFPTEEVSGDYYDWVRIYEDRIALVIADVSGKGIPAALIMAFLRASLRAAMHIGYAPHISMAKVNYLLWESIERNQFVTAFYGVLDASNGVLSYANAGHNPPLLLKADGAAQFIEHGGMPLGMFRDTLYHDYFLKVEAGDIFVMYTDGVTEAVNENDEEFGRERLAAAVIRHRAETARQIIKRIHEELMTWTGTRGADDDVTLFIVKA